MSTLVLQPTVLRWARERAGLDVPTLAKKIKAEPKDVMVWERDGRLSFSQMEKLAKTTHTPIGHLFLAQPLQDRLDIPDFRTVGDRLAGPPSPDLLETVQTMQRRQDWMRDELIEDGIEPLTFVGSQTLKSQPESVAADMRKRLGLESGWAGEINSWEKALAELRHRIEALGILIFFNGVVGNNTSRKLDPEEFRGFALSDEYAPLVFINASDAKSAQMFTIAHELAHLWLGVDAVSNLDAFQPAADKSEQFCNKVAAEFLVPSREVLAAWTAAQSQPTQEFKHLARKFKVSPIVAARRVLDLGLISRESFLGFYREYVKAERRKQDDKNSSGNFWNTQKVRVGERFGRAVIRSAREGRLLYRDAFMLVGFGGSTFDKFASELGFDKP